MVFATEELLKQLHLVDDTTDSQIADTALLGNFELSPTTKQLSLAKVERWLHGYRNVLDKTLERLKVRRGAQERVSLKLLVEELCTLWELETGMLATAHGIVKDVYGPQSSPSHHGHFGVFRLPLSEGNVESAGVDRHGN